MSFYRKLRLPLDISGISHSIKKYGFRKSIKIGFYRLYDIWFDKKYAIDTVGLERLEHLDVGVAGQKIGNQYQPSGILNTREVLKRLAKYEKTGFIDYGSGKGQVLLVARDFGYRNIIGVEFSNQLNQIASQNIRKYCQKKEGNVVPQTINIDAAKFELPEEIDMVYFYHPFKDELFKPVLKKIKDSYDKKAREIIIVYCLPRSRSLFDLAFTHIDHFSVGEYDCEVYKLS